MASHARPEFPSRHLAARRAFKAAASHEPDGLAYGVLTSAASTTHAGPNDDHVATSDDIVTGPFTASDALALRQSIEREAGLQAIVVARYRGVDGQIDWFDVYGRTALEALQLFRTAWETPTDGTIAGSRAPRLDADPQFAAARRQLGA